MNNVIDGPKRQEVPNVVGPHRQGFEVVVDGRHIPNMYCYDRGLEIEFIIDGRFSFTFPKQWGYLASKMAAEAMAIGAGYSNMTAENKDRPFAAEVFEIKE